MPSPSDERTLDAADATVASVSEVEALEMTTTTMVNHRRPLLPAINFMLAAGAVGLGVFALATDDVAGTTSRPPAVVVTEPPEPRCDLRSGVTHC